LTASTETQRESGSLKDALKNAQPEKREVYTCAS